MTDDGEFIRKKLQQIRDEQRSRFGALAKDTSAIHHKLDMLTASFNDLAATHATHGEITAVHMELSRLRQDVTELDARIRELEPEGGTP